MHYAIVKDVEGVTEVIGPNHRIYTDLDTAKADYKRGAIPWHQATAPYTSTTSTASTASDTSAEGLAAQQAPCEWVKHPPRLVSFGESGMTQLLPTCDIAPMGGPRTGAAAPPETWRPHRPLQTKTNTAKLAWPLYP
jgi:hypothetical protein